ncbi:hypothetical protein Hanom_Chr00s169733g01828391 [Helianthus anomalus]
MPEKNKDGIKIQPDESEDGIKIQETISQDSFGASESEEEENEQEMNSLSQEPCEVNEMPSEIHESMERTINEMSCNERDFEVNDSILSFDQLNKLGEILGGDNEMLGSDFSKEAITNDDISNEVEGVCVDSSTTVPMFHCDQENIGIKANSVRGMVKMFRGFDTFEWEPGIIDFMTRESQVLEIPKEIGRDQFDKLGNDLHDQADNFSNASVRAENVSSNQNNVFGSSAPGQQIEVAGIVPSCSPNVGYNQSNNSRTSVSNMVQGYFGPFLNGVKDGHQSSDGNVVVRSSTATHSYGQHVVSNISNGNILD